MECMDGEKKPINFYIYAIGLTIVSFYYGFDISIPGIQSLCQIYITISTGILVVIFAVCAILQWKDSLKEIFTILDWPLAFSAISLFTSIVTVYLSYSTYYQNLLHWLFVFTTTIVFYAILSLLLMITRLRNQVKEQQTSPKTPIASTDLEKQTLIPIRIEKCPICGKIFSGQSDYCELCGKDLTKIDKKKTREFIGVFDSEITNTFTILAAVGAIISLLPVFSNFLVGQDWIPILLSSPLGFFSIILLITASYLGIFFMITLLVTILHSSYLKIFNENNPSPVLEKIIAFLLISIGVLSIFVSVVFLSFIWLVKGDFAISYTIAILLVIGSIAIDLVGTIIIISLIVGSDDNQSKKNRSLKKSVAIVVSIFISIAIILIIVLYAYPATIEYVNNFTHYYESGKSIPVEIKVESINQNNKTPVSLHLNKTTDAYFGKNLTAFDLPYTQCHWSTNFGYFLTITSNNSIIQKQAQEYIVPGCGSYADKLYWTYETSDMGKDKPPIIIGLTVEDRNKKINNVLGDTHIFLDWNNSDTLKISNASIFFSNF